MDSLKNLVLTFTKNIHIFLIVWILSFILLASVSYIIPEKYQAKMVLVTSEDSRSQLQSIGGAGALASLAGVSIKSEASRSQKALAKIKSKSFFIDIIANHGEQILPSLIAAKNYDRESGILGFNKEIYSNSIWYEKKDFDLNGNVFVDKAFNSYLLGLRVTENRTSRIITITYDHISPEFSYEMLKIILERMNESQRNADQMEAEFAIDFINNSLELHANNELKRAASDLLERQLVTLMITESRKYYLLEPIDGPHIPASRSFPSRTLIVLLGESLITMLLFLWLYFRNDLRSVYTNIKSQSN